MFKQRNKTFTTNQSASVFLLDKMTSQEFILIPKENYVKEQPKTSEVLYDPRIDEKAKLLTMLQREDYQTKPKEKQLV